MKHIGTLRTSKGGEQAPTLMMTDLRLLHESGIKKTLQERLITAAHTELHLCECADLMCVDGKRGNRVQVRADP